MADNDQTYGGFENGLDWIADLAIEEYQLNKEGLTTSKKGLTDDKKD